jgi:peptide chain release factor 2
LKSA